MTEITTTTTSTTSSLPRRKPIRLNPDKHISNPALVQLLAWKLNKPQKEVRMFLRALRDVISDAVAAQFSVTVFDFVRFLVRHRGERVKTVLVQAAAGLKTAAGTSDALLAQMTLDDFMKWASSAYPAQHASSKADNTTPETETTTEAE